MKMKKITIIAVTVITILLILISNVNATIKPTDINITDITTTDYYLAAQKGARLLNSLVIVGTVLSIVMFMVLGIKYMMGSVEERAEYKKTMMPMLIGTFLLFTTTTIVGIIGNIVGSIQ